MKTSRIAFYSAIPLLTLFAASAENSHIARAKVIDSTPIIETVYEQVETCRYKQQPRNSYNNTQSNTQQKIIGGLIGGATGSAVGKGSGRDAAAAIGAVVGSEVGEGKGQGITEGEIIGSIAGGLLGNQVGSGKGKTAATAAGALIGSIVGGRIQENGQGISGGNRRTSGVEKVRICDISERPKKVITGYDVTMEYNNLLFSEQLSYRPEDYVDINISFQVLENLTR